MNQSLNAMQCNLSFTALLCVTIKAAQCNVIQQRNALKFNTILLNMQRYAMQCNAMQHHVEQM